MYIDIRCPGTFWDSENDKSHDFDTPFRGTLKPFTIPVIAAFDLKQVMSAPESQYVPTQLRSAYCAPSVQTLASSGTATPVNSKGNRLSQHLTAPSFSTRAVSVPTPLHLGELYSIFLGCSASSTLGNPPISFKRQVYPTFHTHNIHLKYSLSWKISHDCAGEEGEVTSLVPITIIAPSEEQEAKKKKREFGTQGMKKNYDDLEAGIGQGVQFIGQILQAVAG